MDPTATLSLSDADRAELGALWSVHGAGSSMHWTRMVVFAFGTVFLAVVAVVFWASTRTQPSPLVTWGGVAGFGAVSAAAAFGFVNAVRKCRWRVYLFEHGLVLAGSRQHLVRWAQVETLFVEPSGPYERLRLLLRNGTRVKVDNLFVGYDQLAAAIRSEVARSVLESEIAALAGGNSVRFGDLSLSPTSLGHRDRTVAWSAVHSLTIETRAGANSIYTTFVAWLVDPRAKGGKVEWVAVPASQVPNLDAFLRLASGFAEVRNED